MRQAAPAGGLPTSLLPRVTSDLDIIRCAKLLCDKYGDDADLIAAVRADKLLELGEVERHAARMQVLRAIVGIRAPAPTDGEAVH